MSHKHSSKPTARNVRDWVVARLKAHADHIIIQEMHVPRGLEATILKHVAAYCETSPDRPGLPHGARAHFRNKKARLNVHVNFPRLFGFKAVWNAKHFKIV